MRPRGENLKGVRRKYYLRHRVALHQGRRRIHNLRSRDENGYGRRRIHYLRQRGENRKGGAEYIICASEPRIFTCDVIRCHSKIRRGAADYIICARGTPPVKRRRRIHYPSPKIHVALRGGAQNTLSAPVRHTPLRSGAESINCAIEGRIVSSRAEYISAPRDRDH